MSLFLRSRQSTVAENTRSVFCFLSQLTPLDAQTLDNGASRIRRRRLLPEIVR